jgi:hypothetical protein
MKHDAEAAAGKMLMEFFAEVTPECFNRGCIIVSPVVSLVEPPLQACGNDGLTGFEILFSL